VIRQCVHQNEVTESSRDVAKAIRRVRWREKTIGYIALALPPSRSARQQWAQGAVAFLYHRVVDAERASDPFAVTLAAFREQVAWFADRYKVVTAGELARRSAQGDSIQDVAAITFDDGYNDTVTLAAPVLRKFNMPATVFLDTARIDADAPALSTADIRTLVDSGFEIGAHTVTHCDLRHLSDTKLHAELSASRRRLEEITGAAVDGFAYPFGAYDDRVAQAVRHAGYRYAYTCRQHLTNHGGDDPYRLTRVEINCTDTLRRVRRKAAGRFSRVYATWYRINPATRHWRADDVLQEGLPR